MKYLFRRLTILMMGYSIGLAYASNLNVPNLGVGVPFQNIQLKPTQTVTASYSFGQFPIIFCYSDNDVNVGVITWTYKGKPQSGLLPISLTNNSIFQGSLADSAGTITIQNNINTSIGVNCLFAF